MMIEIQDLDGVPENMSSLGRPTFKKIIACSTAHLFLQQSTPYPCQAGVFPPVKGDNWIKTISFKG